MGSRSYSGANAARGLGWLLRARHCDLVSADLPARWVELINCIDENERERLKAALNAAGGNDAALSLQGIRIEERRKGDER